MIKIKSNIASKVLAVNGTAANPSIGWQADNDGTGTGFYRGAFTNEIHTAINGVDILAFSSFGLNVNGSGIGKGIKDVQPSDTAPVFIPNTGSESTGIGAQAAGNLSLITNGIEAIRVTSTGNLFTPILQANLGTPANGIFVYCSDCTIANPCAGGGTGAFAKRLNGVWVCN